MDFKGSKTEKNLLAAFAGESQARNRYTFFASVAPSFVSTLKPAAPSQVSSTFLSFLGECERWFNQLHDTGNCMIPGSIKGVKLGVFRKLRADRLSLGLSLWYNVGVG